MGGGAPQSAPTLRHRFGVGMLPLLALATLGGTGFEDLSVKGSLFDSDTLSIPSAYQGLWAFPLSACGVTRDFGMQIPVGAHTIGNLPITRLQTYSDFPAIMVDFADPDARHAERSYAYLELSVDEKKMRVTIQPGDKETVFSRCKMK